MLSDDLRGPRRARDALLDRHPRPANWSESISRTSKPNDETYPASGARDAKSRIVPVGPQSPDAIDAYRPGRTDNGQTASAIFTGPSGKRLTARTVQRILGNSSSRAKGLESLSQEARVLTRTLRQQLCNTHLLESGLPSSRSRSSSDMQQPVHGRAAVHACGTLDS